MAALAFSFSSVCALGMEKEESLSFDFARGIPSDFGLYDLDGNEPSKTMASLGFSPGIPWIAIPLKDEGDNMVACSTSWYSSPGKSDDWMILPPLSVGSGRYELTWRGKVHDAKFPDGYSVYISTTGSSPEDFRDAPVFTTSSERPEWTSHSVSLSEYDGKTIWIAFVNDSENCSRLYIDDVYAGPHFDVRLTIDLPNVTALPSLDVKGSVTNNGDRPLDGFTVRFSCEGKEMEFHSGNLLQPGASEEFMMPDKLEPESESSSRYEVTVESNGETVYSTSGMVSRYLSNLVVEEGTGAWCGYCVAGNVMMEELSKKYPGRFIGIAIHDNDVLAENTGYYSGLASQFSFAGLPTAVFQRIRAGHPNEMYSLAESHSNDPARILADLGATLSDDKSEISVTVDVTALDDMDSGVTVALVLLEDNVVREGLWQNNGYAGGDHGPMGGYENYNSVIPSSEIPFRHVAHSITDYNGIEESMQTGLRPGDTYSFEYTLSIPKAVSVIENVSVAALLIDCGTLAILNAEEIGYESFLVPGGIRSNEVTAKTETARFDIIGNRLKTPEKGINIIVYSDGSTRKEFVRE